MFYGYEKMLKFFILGAFIISIVWVGILEYIFGIAQLEREYGKNLICVLTMLPSMCLMVVYSYYDEKSIKPDNGKGLVYSTRPSLNTLKPAPHEEPSLTHIKNQCSPHERPS